MLLHFKATSNEFAKMRSECVIGVFGKCEYKFALKIGKKFNSNY